MARIDITMDANGMLNDVPAEKLAHTTEPLRIGGLAGGMGSGKPSVAIAAFLPNDGGCVVAETSLALFLTAADALKARYGDPR
jgi:hypothetical protein